MSQHPTASELLAGNPRAAALYVTSRGRLTPQQCLRLAEEQMFELERSRPWTRWAYVALALATVAVSALKPWGFAS